MFSKKTKFHTLQDIRKILIYFPPIFVFILAAIAIFVTSIILENLQENKINLVVQEEKFAKKKILLNFIDEANDNTMAFFDEVEQDLNHNVFEVRGFITSLLYNNKIPSFEEIKPYILHLEKKENIQFVFFNTKTFEVLHGEKITSYLQTLTNSNINTEAFRKHMLKNIYYLGSENLQYWIDKNKRNIRLSYFEELEEINWYFGAFSKVDDIKIILKKNIINSLSIKSKGFNNYLWYYDYDNDIVHNYDNQEEVSSYKELKSSNDNSESAKILDYYSLHKKSNEIVSENIFNFPKYQYLVGIKNSNVLFPNNIKEKISKIKADSLNKFTTAGLSIVFITAFLVIVSVTFSRYINVIFGRYNRRLEVKNRLLVKWKERYELAILASNNGLWDINLTQNKIYYSNKWIEMFGYKKNEISTFSKLIKLIHKDDKKNVKLNFKKHLEGFSEHFICEYRLRTKNNDYKWVLIRGKIFKEDNIAKRLLIMSMDIEERKQLTKELEDVELLVEYGRIVIFKWKNNNTFDVEYVSKSINSYGYNQIDFESNKIPYLKFIHEDDKDRFITELYDSIDQGKNSCIFIHRVYDNDGKIRWVFFRAIFLKNHFGKITHFYGYINDITKMKLNEEELKTKVKNEVDKNTEKDRLLVHQSKLAAMGEMLGNIAHQWRQPLNNINLLIHFVRDNYGNKNFSKEDLHESIKSAKLQIDYMSQTIDDFRNFYRPTKNKELFNLQKSIEKSAKIVASQFEVNNIKLNISHSDVKINSYENEFQQVIVNILNNAKDAAIIKKSENNFDAFVDISIKENDSIVTIEIRNNCGSATKEVLDRMFEPYFTTKFETQGTGIGLYMAKTIIETNMGGKISAENIENGLKFIIKLSL